VPLEHFPRIADQGYTHCVVYPLFEIFPLMAYGMIVGCNQFDDIAERCEAYLDFGHRDLLFELRGPGSRSRTILMSRTTPTLLSAIFFDWVRKIWLHLSKLLYPGKNRLPESG
jgi:hypothetical protein